jgi:transposase
MKILKQVAGIDVAQKELIVSLGKLKEDVSIEIIGVRAFTNNQKGFASLIAWTEKHLHAEASLQFVLEATGVYHEALAHFLYEKEYRVSIVLPNKISNYIKTLEIKTITDYTCAQAIMRFGLERKLDPWKKPNAIFKRLRQLTREREQIVSERTIVKNEIHAETSEAEPNASSLSRLKKRLQLLNKQEKEVQQEIVAMVKAEPDLNHVVKRITTITGVGVLTAVIVLSETNQFELIRNKRQLASYAGLDVREKTSGTSIRGKATISKRGNRYLRKAMHMPALAAKKFDSRFESIYAKHVDKHGIKMKAVVAIQRRLLEMIYTVYKSEGGYQKDYQPVKKEKQLA